MVPSSYQSSLYAPLTAFFNSPIATAGEVLKSDVVLDEAATALKRQLPESQCPSIAELRGGLSVIAVSNADILQIKFRYKEPKICQLSLEALLNSFIKVTSEQSASSATQSRLFLEKQLKKAREDAIESRESLRKFQIENHMLDFSAQSTNDLQEISTLQDEANKTQVGISAEQARSAFLQGQLKISPEHALRTQKIASDPEIKELQVAIGSGEVKLIELRTKFKEEHPRIQQIKEVVAAARKSLRERLRYLLGDDSESQLDNSAYTTDPVQQKLMGDLVDAKARLLSEQVKLTSIQQEIDSYKAKLAELPAEQLKLAELSRSNDVAKQILSDTERNLHSVRLLEAVASRASNIQILDFPSPALQTEQRTAFGLSISVVLGLILGAATFYAIYLLNPAAQRIKDITALLPMPIMGWVNRLPAGVPKREVLPGLENLRANLRPWLAKGHVRLIVASGDPEDGKTVVASGLAVSLAKNGSKVVLLDLNTAHPSLHEVFELPAAPGLSELLSGSLTIDKALNRVSENLYVLTSGGQPLSFGTIGNRKLQDLLAQVQAGCDVLIADTAAATESADLFNLLGAKVYLLMVARLGNTYRSSLKLVAGQLRHQDFAGGGLVFFDVDEQAIISALSSEPAPAEDSAAEELAAESSHW
jgi:Mrp family chromosome partitioning ATPase/uncharacterized protein involved in exopolysaccharide biosynthesis